MSRSFWLALLLGLVLRGSYSFAEDKPAAVPDLTDMDLPSLGDIDVRGELCCCCPLGCLEILCQWPDPWHRPDRCCVSFCGFSRVKGLRFCGCRARRGCLLCTHPLPSAELELREICCRALWVDMRCHWCGCHCAEMGRMHVSGGALPFPDLPRF